MKGALAAIAFGVLCRNPLHVLDNSLNALLFFIIKSQMQLR